MYLASNNSVVSQIKCFFLFVFFFQLNYRAIIAVKRWTILRILTHVCVFFSEGGTEALVKVQSWWLQGDANDYYKNRQKWSWWWSCAGRPLPSLRLPHPTRWAPHTKMCFCFHHPGVNVTLNLIFFSPAELGSLGSSLRCNSKCNPGSRTDYVTWRYFPSFFG